MIRTVLAGSALLSAAPALVAAGPLNGVVSGLSIPLVHKVSLFHSDSGIVNLDSVTAYIERVKTKFDVSLALDLSLGQRDAVPLSTSDDVQWTGEISLGTPAKKFTAMFDTGSSDVVVPTVKGCNDCFGTQTYDSSSSSSSKGLNKTFSLSYGAGNVTGNQVSDTLTVAGLTASNQTILAAEEAADGFFGKFGALVGLGRSQSSAGATPLVQSLIGNKAADDAVFAFKLAENNSELSLGGLNKALYTGEPTYAPVAGDKYWQISFEKMTFFDKEFKPNTTTSVVDSGTSLVLADSATVAAFYDKVYGSKEIEGRPGMYSVLCFNAPTVNFTISGKTVSIPSDVFSLGPIAENSPDCLGGIQSGSGLPFWVLGDVFMQNIYTIFDVAQNRVGFADLA
ncbi:aspartic peptidase domain-containing protein [Amylostereum chailletii]|nr:aspartic peptidase domain-containing protein [Amylostereum chailletii]